MKHLVDLQAKRQKVDAAWDILTGETTSLEKFEKVRVLLKGLNPRLDTALAATSQNLKKLKQVSQGDVISLTAEALPALTPADKKRKKALLLFLTRWKSLKSEVKRVRKILAEQPPADNPASTASASVAARIGRTAKGPLGLITAAAVVIVAGLSYLQAKSVTVTILNQGCDTLVITRELPVSLPGLKLPQGEIPTGSSAEAVLPPLNVTVNATNPSAITIIAVRFSMEFNLEPGMDLIFNHTSLLGKVSEIRLGEHDQHSLIIQCAD